MNAGSSPQTKSVQTSSPEETRALAASIAPDLKPGDLIALNGDLGAGKTIFAQGLGRGLGVPGEHALRSPTFAIFDVHEGRHPLVHVDLYRIENPEEIEALGILDLLNESVVVVEWFERAHGMLGNPICTVSLSHCAGNPNTRTITIET